MEKTKENLISILSEATHKENLEEINFNQSMKDQGIDSLDAMSFFFAIEKAFDIKISIDDQNKMQSLNDILNFIQSNK